LAVLGRTNLYILEPFTVRDIASSYPLSLTRANVHTRTCCSWPKKLVIL
jgi:hypothetical protein